MQHGDHFFGNKVFAGRFPNVKALATPEVVTKMRLQITPEKLNDRWRKLFPNQIPDVISIAGSVGGNDGLTWKEASWSCAIRAYGHGRHDVPVTSHRSDWSSPAMPSTTAFHPFLNESNRQTVGMDRRALDKIDALKPSALLRDTRFHERRQSAKC